MEKQFSPLAFLMLCLMLIGLTAYAQDDDLVSLRIMTYNIQHGAGMDDVVNLDKQATIIENAMPDVVGLQEVDSCVKRSGYLNEAAVLARKLGMYATFGPAIPLSAGKYGVAVLSKEQPLSVRNIPLPGVEKRTMLVCEFQDYVFASTHLDLNEDNRLASADIIIGEAARWEKPFFICGDWNDTPTSALLTKMKKKFQFLNYLNTIRSNYTFPADNPTSIIDYIATYGHIVKSIKSRSVLNEPDASDHRPVVVEITMTSYTTGITQPSESNEPARDEGIYDISGKRVTSSKATNTLLPRGLYILKNERRLIAVN